MIIPALLTNNINDLKQKLAKLNGLVDWIQIDIMDNIFVPNISILVKDLFNIKTNANLEAHLMIKNPENTFEDCAKIGFKRVYFHFEAVDNVEKILNKMDEFDFEKGIAINPDTPIEKILPFIDKLNAVLFMSVFPGFQNQKFIPEVLNKVKELKKQAPKIKIAIDGGVKKDNVKLIKKAGVDLIGVGSAVFENDEVKRNLEEFNEIINNK